MGFTFILTCVKRQHVISHQRPSHLLVKAPTELPVLKDYFQYMD